MTAPVQNGKADATGIWGFSLPPFPFLRCIIWLGFSVFFSVLSFPAFRFGEKERELSRQPESKNGFIFNWFKWNRVSQIFNGGIHGPDEGSTCPGLCPGVPRGFEIFCPIQVLGFLHINIIRLVIGHLTYRLGCCLLNVLFEDASGAVCYLIAATVRGKCFDKCITKPGSSLSGSESSCISRCVDRYIEATGIVGRAIFNASR
ncbi:hypothetical protein DITRI_Ditri07aG0110500 [Diplodiscus trichospermus]